MEFAVAMPEGLADEPLRIYLLTTGDKNLASYKQQMSFPGLHASHEQCHCAGRQ